MRRTTQFTLILLAIAAVADADERRAVEVDQAAPDFTVTGIDGELFRLSEKLKGNEKRIVLIFSRANW